MIKKLSKLSLNKRTAVYLSSLLFFMGVLISVAVWVPIHFELGFDDQYTWLFFSALVIVGVVFFLIWCIGKSEDKIISSEKETDKQEFLEVTETSHPHWIFKKFKENKAVYAFCPYCGFQYNPSYPDENLEPVITSVYKYCPMCAEFLYVSPEKIVIDKKDERYISELYK